MAKIRTVTGGGLLATALLVLIFGNQAVAEWVGNHTSADDAWGWFLRVLTWPHWTVSTDGSGNAVRALLSADLRALLLILFVAILLAIFSKGISTGSTAFFLGWAGLVFASALAAFVCAFILADPTLVGAFGAAALGSVYGLFVGWIVGIATSFGKRTAA